MPNDKPKHRILVVEDEALISMLIEDMVQDCGDEVVGPIAKYDQALGLIDIQDSVLR
jgi:CheY-like chemotaxis protein